MVKRMSIGERDPETEVPIPYETHPEQDHTREKHPLTPSQAQMIPTMMMKSAAHTITQPKPSHQFPLKTATRTNDVMGTMSQGRLYTLSSTVRPISTTATRTVAIT